MLCLPQVHVLERVEDRQAEHVLELVLVEEEVVDVDVLEDVLLEVDERLLHSTWHLGTKS